MCEAYRRARGDIFKKALIVSAVVLIVLGAGACESRDDASVPMIWRGYGVQIDSESYYVAVAGSLSPDASDEQYLCVAYPQELRRQGRLIVHYDSSGFSFELRDGGTIHRPGGAAVLYDPQADKMTVLTRDWPARRCLEDEVFGRKYIVEMLTQYDATQAGD